MSLKYYLRGLGTGMAVTALIMGIALGGKETLSDDEIRERAARLGMTEGGKVLADLEESRESGQDSDSQQSGASYKDPEQKNSEDITQGDGDESASPDKEGQDATAPGGEDQGNTSQDKENQGNVSQSGENQGNASQNGENQANISQGQEKPDSIPPAQTVGQEQGESPADGGRNEGDLEQDLNPAKPPETQEPQVGEMFTITVRPGDSSETVSRALAGAGLVEDAAEYDKYLCANGYDKKICVGSYQIEAGATGEDIALIITKKK